MRRPLASLTPRSPQGRFAAAFVSPALLVLLWSLLTYGTLSPIAQSIGFGLRVLAAIALVAFWASLNVPLRKPSKSRVIVRIADFADVAGKQVSLPARTLQQLLRPRPAWEPVVDEEGMTSLALPAGGLELASLLRYPIGKQIGSIPDVAVVALPYIGDPLAALRHGRSAGAHIVVWGRAQKHAGPAGLRFGPRITVTRRLEPPIGSSDFRLCGLDMLTLGSQRLHVWNNRYLGLQHLQSLLQGLVLYAYGARREAANELAAVRVTAEGDEPSVAGESAARLLYGNLPVLDEAWAEAEQLYLGVDVEPLAAAAAVNLGVLDALRGEPVQSLDCLQPAKRADPGSLRVLKELGAVYVAERQFERAISILTHVRDLDPSRADLVFDLGLAYEAAGRMQEALESFEVALQLAPSDGADPQLWYKLGQIFISAGPTDRANEAYRMYADKHASVPKPSSTRAVTISDE